MSYPKDDHGESRDPRLVKRQREVSLGDVELVQHGSCHGPAKFKLKNDCCPTEVEPEPPLPESIPSPDEGPETL